MSLGNKSSVQSDPGHQTQYPLTNSVQAFEQQQKVTYVKSIQHRENLYSQCVLNVLRRPLERKWTPTSKAIKANFVTKDRCPWCVLNCIFIILADSSGSGSPAGLSDSTTPSTGKHRWKHYKSVCLHLMAWWNLNLALQRADRREMKWAQRSSQDHVHLGCTLPVKTSRSFSLLCFVHSKQMTQGFFLMTLDTLVCHLNMLSTDQIDMEEKKRREIRLFLWTETRRNAWANKYLT